MTYSEYVTPSDSEFVQTVFGFCAVACWIIGLILGFVLGRDLRGDFSFGVALVWWIGFFIAGVGCWALAKVIEYLHVIATNTAFIARNTGEANDIARKDL